MAYSKRNPNGQATMANSSPVVIANDQTAIPVSINFADLAGISTAAKQDLGNSSLSSIDLKTPSLGQALAGASVPVVLTAAQLITLTPPAAITNYALETGGNLAAIAASASILDDWDESDRAKVNVIVGQAGVDGNSGNKSAATIRVVIATDQPQLTNALKVDGSAVTQPVSATDLDIRNLSSGQDSVAAVQSGSWTVTANAGTNLNTSALLTTADFNAAFGTAGSSDTQVLSIQGIAGMTKLLVTPDANSAVNAAQIAGNATAVNNGGVSNGTQRVTIANDSTGVLASIGSITSSVTPGTAAANLGKAEDSIHNSGDTGVFVLHVANEAQTTLAADGDYIGGSTDIKGNRMSVGNIAHDGVDAGAPIKIGGKARTAPPTAVAASDRVDAMFDIYGKQIFREALREDIDWQQTQISSSTSETTIVTADATYKKDIFFLSVANTSATACKVTLKDSTTGTVRWVGYVPAGDMRGFVVSPSGALKQAAANNNWTLTCGTSVAAIEVTAAWVRSL